MMNSNTPSTKGAAQFESIPNLHCVAGRDTVAVRLQVLATVSPITNIICNVSGDHGDHAGLVPGPDTSVQRQMQPCRPNQSLRHRPGEGRSDGTEGHW